MNAVFADAVYWIALTNPKGQWHETAIAARIDHPVGELGTMEDVLVDSVHDKTQTNLHGSIRSRLRG